MGYEKYYQDGWKSGEAGGTPITPEALNHMEAGIEAAGDHADNKANPHGVTAAQVGARPNTWTPTAEQVGAVPTSRTVNGKALSGNITLSASDVGAVSKNGDTMTGQLKLNDGIAVVGDTAWNAYTFKKTDGTVRGSMMVSNTNALHFNVPASDSTYSDRYILGRPSTGLTGDRWFDVLTSKSAVTVAQGGTGATKAADARKNLGLEAFETKIVTNSSAKGLFQSVKDVFSSLSTNVVYVIRVSDTTPQRFAIGQKYGGNYGYFIGCTLDGLYYYRNYNGSWAEKAIATW